MSSSPKKSACPNRQLKNNTIRRYNSGANFFSKQNENLAYNPSIIHGGGGGGGGGLLFAPPPSLSFSYNPSVPFLNPLSYQQQLQPPILPLPVPLPCRTRSLSYSSPSDVKNNRKKDPKRSKSKQLTGKPVEEPKKRQLKPTEATKTQAVNNYKPSAFGPVPNATPNPKVSNDLDKYTGSIFTLSPPPSSLPLPSFSLRPKLSCNAEAASADDVRRILRLP
ncbi:hypothetical protein V6N11_018013 [Hibiscus sabdariffa]|uniref:Uncharacterized protein n=1 Tax=Hibiscus sabdariffa TaxID=183260 RepID=A0ABR2T648_9ROSI